MNSVSTLQLSPSDWNSVYIPFLPKDLMLEGIELNNEETLKTYVETKLFLGKVSRIDFINKQTKTDEKAQSAFIHFEYWNTTSIAFRNFLEKYGECKIKGCTIDGNDYSEFVSSKNPNIKRFVTFKINKTPIQEVKEAPKNIHQIVNNYSLMEKLIDEQKQIIEEQNQKIEFLQYLLDNQNKQVTMDEYFKGKNEIDIITTNDIEPNMFIRRESTMLY